MTITPDKKREIENEIAKFLRHLMLEKKEQLLPDVIDVKSFDLNMHPHPQPVNISPR